MSGRLPEFCLSPRDCHHFWVKPCTQASVAASHSPGSTHTNSSLTSVTRWACGFQVRGASLSRGRQFWKHLFHLSLGVWLFAITPLHWGSRPFLFSILKKVKQLEPQQAPIFPLPQNSSQTCLVPSSYPAAPAGSRIEHSPVNITIKYVEWTHFWYLAIT